MSEEPLTFVERSEDELSRVSLVAGETLRAAEVSVIALAALLVCPPLLILAVIVVVPALAVADVADHVHRHHAEYARQRER